MSNVEKRIEALEKAVTHHLEESGEIRADIKWLKKSIWFVLGSPIITEILVRLLPR